MSNLNPIAIATKGKGVLGMVKRAQTIRRRYGLTPDKMERTLAHFVEVLDPFGCGATFPITTVTLARSRGAIEKYQAKNIEFAVHGYYHVDQSALTFQEQLSQFTAAQRLFAERGIRCDGFRSPYLRSSPGTLVAVKQAGFLYDSSQALAWEVPSELETGDYRRALGFYGAVSAADYPALPRWDNDLVRIPYCLPDDEAFVDRFKIAAEEMTELWLSILEQTYARGELFTLALHPERIYLCQQALVETLEEARRMQPQVWMARLVEIAKWWIARAEAPVAIREGADGELSVQVDGPEGVTLLARGVEVLSPSTEWDGSYRMAEGASMRLRSVRRPFIGVSTATPLYLRSFLRQQGFIVEETNDPNRHSLYLDTPYFVYEDERALLTRIEHGDSPLVRLGRWPNGARSALCVTGDIDALTIWDYALRLF